MDFFIKTKVDQNTRERRWDFQITNGKLDIVDYKKAEYQRACVAVYLQRGTVPQMPSIGNEWAELLTGQVMPQTVNAEVRSSIMDMTGALNYAPQYSSVDGKLEVNVVEV